MLLYVNISYLLFKVCALLAAGDIILSFVIKVIGGPLFGLVVARVVVFWLGNIFNDAMVEITITLSSTYLTFFIGEQYL